MFVLWLALKVLATATSVDRDDRKATNQPLTTNSGPRYAALPGNSVVQRCQLVDQKFD